jgi:hypothetical protein
MLATHRFEHAASEAVLLGRCGIIQCMVHSVQAVAYMWPHRKSQPCRSCACLRRDYIKADVSPVGWRMGKRSIGVHEWSGNKMKERFLVGRACHEDGIGPPGAPSLPSPILWEPQKDEHPSRRRVRQSFPEESGMLRRRGDRTDKCSAMHMPQHGRHANSGVNYAWKAKATYISTCPKVHSDGFQISGARADRGN